MRLLVTAGPTREYFDTVRFISNPSSGKMGYAIAIEGVRRGHEVVLVSGPVELPEPTGVKVIHVVSAEGMLEVCESVFEDCDALVMTAAVCDYRPRRTLDHKLKKHNRVRPIQLQPTTDILARLGECKGERITIGFAMEDHDEREHAEAKLKRKKCNAIVLNGLANVAGDTAEVQIFRPDTGWGEPVVGSKTQVAAVIVDLAESLWAGRRAAG